MAIAGGLLMVMVSWLMGTTRGDNTIQIVRHQTGDIFKAPAGQCRQWKGCSGLSGGTALNATSPADADFECTCQCQPNFPTFREDLRICVNDIHECALSAFESVSGGDSSSSQAIPFVFLPLKGQIIHPSNEIRFPGVQTPVCAISGAKYLTEGGWLELRNPLDTGTPFRLYHDEGRNLLQWVGEADLRLKMSGRLVLVHLMCREAEHGVQSINLFSPCVAFRVVGSPKKASTPVNEVAFSSDAPAEGSTMTVSEYIAIGICSVLLGLIYVASVFLYIYLKKRNLSAPALSPQSQTPHESNLSNIEEGIIKSNPLLNISRYGPTELDTYSTSSDTPTYLPATLNHINRTQSVVPVQHTIAAQVHSRSHSSPGDIEKLPEENVSIVETLERDDLDLTLTSNGTIRRKLYFNPAYFEPQLLATPPPAALDFLSKIREVIAIAKQKIDMRKFTPSLLGIPEEDCDYVIDPLFDPTHPSISRRSSNVSLKRENSRRRPEVQRHASPSPHPPLLPCHRDSREHSVQKWLDGILPPTQDLTACQTYQARSLPPSGPPRDLSPTRSVSERLLPDVVKKHMNRVIHELSKMVTTDCAIQSSATTPVPTPPNPKDYETDSLERTNSHTPKTYTEPTSSQASPSLSTALPLDEEMTMRNAVMSKHCFNSDIVAPNNIRDVGSDSLYACPSADFTHHGQTNSNVPILSFSKANTNYNLVSEVYVNNGYNSDVSTTERNTGVHQYCPDLPGKLLIQVQDCADHYLPVPTDSDSFEQDTLDRKPQKQVNSNMQHTPRTQSIQLRSRGSFKRDHELATGLNGTTPAPFGSLREIFEASRSRDGVKSDSTFQRVALEERHSKRQRSLLEPPDIIPPPAPLAASQQHSKNAHGRSANPFTNIIAANGTPEVTNYSKLLLQKIQMYAQNHAGSCDPQVISRTEKSGTDSDDSSIQEDDGHSESGGESVETHSVFFNCFRKSTNVLKPMYGSMDSGVDDTTELESTISDRIAYVSAKTLSVS